MHAYVHGRSQHMGTPVFSGAYEYIAHVCEGQRLTQNAFFDQALLFLNQELADLASLVSSVPWEPLCSPPGYWGYQGAAMHDCLAFTWALGL